MPLHAPHETGYDRPLNHLMRGSPACTKTDWKFQSSRSEPVDSINHFSPAKVLGARQQPCSVTLLLILTDCSVYIFWFQEQCCGTLKMFSTACVVAKASKIEDSQCIGVIRARHLLVLLPRASTSKCRQLKDEMGPARPDRSEKKQPYASFDDKFASGAEMPEPEWVVAELRLMQPWAPLG